MSLGLIVRMATGREGRPCSPSALHKLSVDDFLCVSAPLRLCVKNGTLRAGNTHYFLARLAALQTPHGWDIKLYLVLSSVIRERGWHACGFWLRVARVMSVRTACAACCPPD